MYFQIFVQESRFYEYRYLLNDCLTRIHAQCVRTPANVLIHYLFCRDFGCVVGLANVRGLCRKSGNTGFTKTQLVNKVNKFAS